MRKFQVTLTVEGKSEEGADEIREEIEEAFGCTHCGITDRLCEVDLVMEVKQ